MKNLERKNLERREIVGLEDLKEYRRTFERLKECEPQNVLIFEALARMVELNDVYTNTHHWFFNGSGFEHVEVTRENSLDDKLAKMVTGEAMSDERVYYVDDLIADIYQYIKEIQEETA